MEKTLPLDPALAEAQIKSVTSNSKDVVKGSIFVAIEGSVFDGHKFMDEALMKGASAVVVKKGRLKFSGRKNIIETKDTRKALSVIAKNFYHSPSDKLKTVGITGTNGKTTTSYLLESIFKKEGIPCGVLGTIEYRLGDGIAISAARTTPDSIEINKMLDQMVKRDLKAAIMEISSHALDQKRVDDISLDAAVFTNITHEHLDYHGNLENYFKSKARIFSNIKQNGFAVINADDKKAPCIKRMIRHKKITYSLRKSASVTAAIESVTADGSFFSVRIGKKNAFRVNTKLAGVHNISNILAAIAVSTGFKVNPCSIKEGVEAIKHVPGRLERIDNGSGIRIFVDYAHTPDALMNVLKFLRRNKEGHIITVFGCGGDRDRAKRPVMGSVVQKYSDYFIITSDNPRNEDPERIARGIENGIKRDMGNYSIILDRGKAIEAALRKAQKGDIVLIAGKGHEKVQIIGEGRIPFDDKKVAREALAAARSLSGAKQA